jgi:type IV pilus assembly protein PilC
MTNFKYVAVNGQGKTIEGTVDTTDRAAVLVALSKQSLRPISIKEVSSGKVSLNFNILLGKNKVKSGELVIFTRQLSTMISAGVPLLRGLESLGKHAESAALKKIIEGIIKEIEGGAPFGDALAKYPNTFNDVYVNMVRAGEAAGILDEILKRLALQQEKNATIRKKIKSAMAYPSVLIVIMTVAFFGLMLFVIPQIGKILKDLGGPDAQLPLLTQFMLGLSAFLLSYWFIIIPAVAGGIFLLLRYIKTPRGKSQFHHLILKVPAVKGIIRKVAVARFARTFSALMGAGVAVLEALSVTGHAIGNVVYEEALIKAAEEVKNGKQLSQVIEGYEELFPPIVAQMLSVGEETGQTDTVLVKVADFYEEEVDVAIDGLSAVIEPVMIVMMGSMVGLIAASVMGPIASLSQNIK